MNRHAAPLPVTLLRRLLRAQLRFRIMAGAVIVTLVALATFGFGAVITMRGALLAQTDANLRAALALSRPRVPALLGPAGRVVVRNSPATAGADPADGGTRTVHGTGTVHTLTEGSSPEPEASQPAGNVTHQSHGQDFSPVGPYGIMFLNDDGARVLIQTAASGGPSLTTVLRSNSAAIASAAKVAEGSGADPVSITAAGAQVRLGVLPVTGGVLVASTALAQVNQTVDEVGLVVAIGSAAVAAFIGAGVFLVLRRGLRPIETMAMQADRITAGDLTKRVTTHAPRSEVGRLSAALNGMLSRIEAAVRERERSQQEMRRFFADASHELRTPLASLRANAELYQQGAVSPGTKLDEVMRRIVLETRRMGRLVDDMLRLARLGAQPEPDFAPVDLTAVVEGCAERAQVAQPGRAWRVSVAPGLRAMGDEELLRRAVDNLLGNVRAHSPQTAACAITAALAGDGTVVIEVSDEGPGVPEDKLPHIFERFYRAGAGPAGSGPALSGSGLGLAIVAEIAAVHGGTATASGASPSGLRVTLTLPAASPADATPPPDRLPGSAPPAPASRPPPKHPRKRLLLL